MNTDNVEQNASADVPAQAAPYVQRITELLTAAGHPNPSGWQNLLHPDAFVVTDGDIQRFLINRTLRLVIARAPENTMDARFCCVDNGDLEDWLRLVQEQVIPCTVRHNLPLST